MRILILGATGMLGHRLWQYFSGRFAHTYATIRQGHSSYEATGLFNSDRVIEFVDVTDFPVLTGILKSVRPDFILNCVGVTKRRKEVDMTIQTISVNALLPHKLVEWGRHNTAKVINFSTDCVFNGVNGNYTEESSTNASDLYGKTKALGEIQGENALTLRSSFIGTELGAGTELLEWLLSQEGQIKGFKNAIYSGFTTLELCRIIERILVHYPSSTGLYNVSSEPISKFDLLMLIKKKLHLNIDIIPEETFTCDRSLNSTKFRNKFEYLPPSWEAMIEELSKDICEMARVS